jgi:hypothetical protein
LDFQKKIKTPNCDTVKSLKFLMEDKARTVHKIMALNLPWQLAQHKIFKDFYSLLFLKPVYENDFIRNAELVSAEVIHFENLVPYGLSSNQPKRPKSCLKRITEKQKCDALIDKS